MRIIDADALKKDLLNQMELLFDTEIAELIDNQPTISQWIPVSERLPSDYGNYLVSTNDDRVLECDIGTYCDWDGKWNGCDANGFVRDIDVVAWMPLPEPYKESENDD